MKRKLTPLALVCSLLLCSAPVFGDDGFYIVGLGGVVGTPISKVPYIITQPGFYYLKGDLTVPSSITGITVNANNVTIDLMGFSLIGPNSNKGIYINGYSNLEVRNGTLTQFEYAIDFHGKNCRFINIRTITNTYGIYGSENSINTIVKGCTVSDNSKSGIRVTGSATISGNVLFNYLETGIMLFRNCLINNNTVSSVSGSGIVLVDNGSIIGNIVMAINIGSKEIDLSNGGPSTNVMLDQNTISGSGVHLDEGVVRLAKGTNAY